MSLPWAFNSLANAAIAKVCEVDRLLILSDKILIVLLYRMLNEETPIKASRFMLC